MNPTIRKNAFLASSTSISAARRRWPVSTCPRLGAVPELGLVMLLFSTSFPVTVLARGFDLALVDERTALPERAVLSFVPRPRSAGGSAQHGRGGDGVGGVVEAG